MRPGPPQATCPAHREKPILEKVHGERFPLKRLENPGDVRAVRLMVLDSCLSIDADVLEAPRSPSGEHAQCEHPVLYALLDLLLRLPNGETVGRSQNRKQELLVSIGRVDLLGTLHVPRVECALESLLGPAREEGVCTAR